MMSYHCLSVVFANAKPTKDPDTSDQLPVRRSPNIIDSDDQKNPNKVLSDRPRIPSTWITSSTTTTTQRTTTTRVPLRTTQPSMRTPPVTVRAPPANRPVNINSVMTLNSTTDSFHPHVSFLLFPSQVSPTAFIDNIFLPRPNGAITKSINKLIDQTERVVVNVGQLFRSTFEIITGTG
jgi:hypothetical protein